MWNGVGKGSLKYCKGKGKGKGKGKTDWPLRAK